MSHQLSPDHHHLFALSEIARFQRAYHLAFGDSLAEAVARVKREFDITEWALEIWKLGRDSRCLLDHYASYVRSIGRSSGSAHELNDEFTKFELLVDRIASICDKIGLKELKDDLQRELTVKAEGGAFRSDEAVYLEGFILNPSIALWDSADLKHVIETKILPKLVWPNGYSARSFDSVDVSLGRLLTGDGVSITVLVGEKIKGRHPATPPSRPCLP